MVCWCLFQPSLKLLTFVTYVANLNSHEHLQSFYPRKLMPEKLNDITKLIHYVTLCTFKTIHSSMACLYNMDISDHTNFVSALFQHRHKIVCQLIDVEIKNKNVFIQSFQSPYYQIASLFLFLENANIMCKEVRLLYFIIGYQSKGIMNDKRYTGTMLHSI